MSDNVLTLTGGTARHDDFGINVGDKTYHLPLLQHLPVSSVSRLTKLQRLPEKDNQKQLAMVEYVVDLLDQYCPGLTDIITQEDLGTIFAAWSDASSAGLGE